MENEKIQEYDGYKIPRPRHFTEEELKELNKPKETIGLSMIGNYKLQKGKEIYLNIKKYNLEGVFLIKTASHTIDKQKEIVSVSLERE